jgi:hypothetical protein
MGCRDGHSRAGRGLVRAARRAHFDVRDQLDGRIYSRMEQLVTRLPIDLLWQPIRPTSQHLRH